MTPPAPDHDLALGAHQSRTVRVLVVSQVLGGVGVASGIAVGGLLAEEVSGSTSLAGLSQTGTVLGAALLAVPLARLAARSGRRHALAAGYVAGLVGAALTVLAGITGQFWLLLVGAVLFGGATAANLQARYAATDSATPATTGRALAIVVWATTIGAVAGPNLSGVGGDLARRVGLTPLAGPYLFSLVAFVAGAVVVALLLRAAPRPPVETDAVRTEPGVSTASVLAVVWRTPLARLALAAIAAAHAVMVGVMVMTPVHLGHGGASLEVVGIVISVHIAGMYAFSPLFGWLTDRVGRVPVVAAGLALLLVSLMIAAGSGVGDDGMGAVQVGVALTLLGLGWSCCVVAGSTLLSESVPVSVRIPAQGASDLVMGVAGAGAGALAGPVLAGGGYAALSLGAAVLLVPVAALAVPMLRRPRTV